MKKLFVIVMILVLSMSFVLAEELDVKKMDAGLRGGPRYGVTGRYFLSESNNVEALIAFRGSGIILTGLYEWQKPLTLGDIEGLTWYFGGGVHAGYWRVGSVYGTDLALGIDGIVGVEYDLEPLVNLPISASLDYKPGFDIFGRWAGVLYDVALSVRYAF